MKQKFYFCLIALLFTFSMVAQSVPSHLQVATMKKMGTFDNGETFTLRAVNREIEIINGQTSYSENIYYYLVSDDNRVLPIKSKKDIKALEFYPQNIQDFWDMNIIKYVFLELQKEGLQYDLRTDMEQDALDYVYKVKSYGLELDDPYLENYIYSLIAKILPQNIVDGRPYNVNLLILQNPEMNMCMYPNGTLEITTGLISRLHTEDELVAVLGHEIAHFLLDHNIQNVNKEISRQKRAEFWAGLTTLFTAVTECVIASQNSNYIPGMATLSVAQASQAIANQVVKRLGMEYNHEQEVIADQVTIEMLKLLGYSPNALSTAFARIKVVQDQEWNSSAYFESYTHPALIERINSCGIPNITIKNQDFEKYISFAVSNVANMKFQDRKFRQAMKLVSQNVANGVATDNDYLLKAYCLFALYDSVETNSEAMDLINQAKELNPGNIYVYKAEILGALRLGKKEVANKLLISYRQMAERYEYFQEINWTKDMLCKLRGM